MSLYTILATFCLSCWLLLNLAFILGQHLPLARRLKRYDHFSCFRIWGLFIGEGRPDSILRLIREAGGEQAIVRTSESQAPEYRARPLLQAQFWYHARKLKYAVQRGLPAEKLSHTVSRRFFDALIRREGRSQPNEQWFLVSSTCENGENRDTLILRLK